jgi:glutamyl-tRNA synthetase
VFAALLCAMWVGVLRYNNLFFSEGICVKSRFCPSPTGNMHVGNARTALFNFLIAQAQQGIFLLRIEDTDAARSDLALADTLMSDLQWLGLSWQEGPQIGGAHAPYFQSQRQEIYDAYYEKLIEQDKVYPCFCSDEELMVQRKIQIARGQPPRYSGLCRHLTDAERKEKLQAGLLASLRFRVPEQAEIVFDDLVRGKQVFLTQNIGDFIIRRADGSASFLFCNAVDDALMGVDTALRGEDHLSNTPRQLLIAQALQLPTPQYGHIALILGSDGAPLSKRNGSMSIGDLRAAGFLPKAVLNYLARLGHYYEQSNWLELADLALFFQTQNLATSPARFDQEQLMHWQREAVVRLDEKEFWHWCDAEISALVPSQAKPDFFAGIRANVLFPTEVALWAKILYQSLSFTDEAIACIQHAGSDYFKQALALWSDCLEFKAFSKALGQALSLKGQALFAPLRMALTCQNHGPELAVLHKLLGNQEIEARLQQALELCL